VVCESCFPDDPHLSTEEGCEPIAYWHLPSDVNGSHGRLADYAPEVRLTWPKQYQSPDERCSLGLFLSAPGFNRVPH